MISSSILPDVAAAQKAPFKHISILRVVRMSSITGKSKAVLDLAEPGGEDAWLDAELDHPTLHVSKGLPSDCEASTDLSWQAGHVWSNRTASVTRSSHTARDLQMG